jgi:hypothetical protein
MKLLTLNCQNVISNCSKLKSTQLADHWMEPQLLRQLIAKTSYPGGQLILMNPGVPSAAGSASHVYIQSVIGNRWFGFCGAGAQFAHISATIMLANVVRPSANTRFNFSRGKFGPRGNSSAAIYSNTGYFIARVC